MAQFNRERNVNQVLLAAAVGLLACSVLLQVLILQKMPKFNSQPVPVSIVGISTLNELPVSISTNPVPVSISEVSTTERMPVSIDSISTIDELKVDLQNHQILSAAPIPVEIVH